MAEIIIIGLVAVCVLCFFDVLVIVHRCSIIDREVQRNVTIIGCNAAFIVAAFVIVAIVLNLLK